jgi:hypothetical protein
VKRHGRGLDHQARGQAAGQIVVRRLLQRGGPAVWREVATGRRRAMLLGRASAFPDVVFHRPRRRPENPSQNVVTRTNPHERLETSQIGPFLFLLAILWPPTHGDLPYLMKQPP